MARPPKYTPERAKKIIDAIKLGATWRLACLYAGISDETLSRWRVRYVDFAQSLYEAEGAAAIGWLAKIEKAANEGDWRAAFIKLERRYPYEYGRQIQEVSGPQGGPIQLENVTSLTEEERADRIAAVLERAGKRLAGPAPAAGPYLGSSNGSTNGSVAH